MGRRCASCVRAAPWVGIGGNTLIAGLQWYVGTACNSQAVIADATHTTFDLVGALAAYVTVRLSRRAASARYPYGLGKLEDITASAIYIVLITAGTTICVNALHTLVEGNVLTPKLPAVFVTVVSITGNALMYCLINCAGHRAKSPALIALACECRSDSLSSVAVLIGVVGAILGVAHLDPLAAFIVGAMIAVGNVRALYQAAHRLTDAALPRSVQHEVERAARSVPHVQGVLTIKSRLVGLVSHADIDVLVDPDISVEAAQAVSDAVAERVRIGIKGMKFVRVYTHPARDEKAPERATRLAELLAAMRELRTQQQK